MFGIRIMDLKNVCEGQEFEFSKTAEFRRFFRKLEKMKGSKEGSNLNL